MADENGEYEEDDNFDNDAGLGYDDYEDGADEDEDVPEADTEGPESQGGSSSEAEGGAPLTPGDRTVRPILKPSPGAKEEGAGPPLPKPKSVRFSLKPQDAHIPDPTDPLSTPASKQNGSVKSKSSSPVSQSPQMVNRAPTHVTSANSQNKPTTSNENRLGEKGNQQKCALTQAIETAGIPQVNDDAIKSNSQKSSGKEPLSLYERQRKERKQPPAIIEANQKQIVSEILKRNPNILKGKNEVKVKVVVKDKEGKSKTETIVLRSQAYVPLQKRFPQGVATNANLFCLLFGKNKSSIP